MHSPFQQLLVVFCFSFSIFTASAATAAPELELKPFRDGLYQFANGEGEAGVVLITSQGAIVGDPLDEPTAQSLSALLAREFKIPVKYVFYTHADVSRAAGAKVFAEAGALVIAHANVLQSAAVIDGLISSPDLVFTDSMSVRLGNQSVKLEHLGNNVSDNMLVARFAWQQTVFAADFVAIENLPTLALDQGFFPDWFLSIDRLSKLDFVYFLDGQGKAGNRIDAKQHEYYLRELHNRVGHALEKGQTEQQMLDSINMAKYRNWGNYRDALPENIRSMHKVLKSDR